MNYSLLHDHDRPTRLFLLAAERLGLPLDTTSVCSAHVRLDANHSAWIGPSNGTDHKRRVTIRATRLGARPGIDFVSSRIADKLTVESLVELLTDLKERAEARTASINEHSAARIARRGAEEAAKTAAPKRPSFHDRMTAELSVIVSTLRVLAGDDVGDGHQSWQDVAVDAAAAMRRYADMLDEARSGRGGSFVSFPSIDDATDRGGDDA